MIALGNSICFDLEYDIAMSKGNVFQWNMQFMTEINTSFIVFFSYVSLIENLNKDQNLSISEYFKTVALKDGNVLT